MDKAVSNAFEYSIFENNTSYDNWIMNPGLELGENVLGGTDKPGLMIKLDKMWNDRLNSYPMPAVHLV